jgi:hypothetical protein
MEEIFILRQDRNSPVLKVEIFLLRHHPSCEDAILTLGFGVIIILYSILNIRY